MEFTPGRGKEVRYGRAGKDGCALLRGLMGSLEKRRTRVKLKMKRAVLILRKIELIEQSKIFKNLGKLSGSTG